MREFGDLKVQENNVRIFTTEKRQLFIHRQEDEAHLNELQEGNRRRQVYTAQRF
jgi:hypothetical protein